MEWLLRFLVFGLLVSLEDNYLQLTLFYGDIMKKLFLSLILLLGLVGCGKDYEYKEVFVDKEITIAQDFEGVYYLNNGSFIELVASSDNEVTILREGYNLTSENPKNSTLGTHPVVTRENLEPNNRKLFFSLNVNYGNSNQYDLEEDVNGSDITGTRRTDYLFELINDNNIKITVKIYQSSSNNNINKVVATRVFESY